MLLPWAEEKEHQAHRDLPVLRERTEHKALLGPMVWQGQIAMSLVLRGMMGGKAFKGYLGRQEQTAKYPVLKEIRAYKGRPEPIRPYLAHRENRGYKGQQDRILPFPVPKDRRGSFPCCACLWPCPYWQR